MSIVNSTLNISVASAADSIDVLVHFAYVVFRDTLVSMQRHMVSRDRTTLMCNMKKSLASSYNCHIVSQGNQTAARH